MALSDEIKKVPLKVNISKCVSVLLRIFQKVRIVVWSWVCLQPLRFYSSEHLARIAREHHLGIVRERAWMLSGAFIAGEQTYFGWHISVIVEHWGDLAVRVGHRVSIAPGVIFVAATGPNASHLVHIKGFTDKYVKYAPITVNDDAWIGAGAILLPGVIIGKCSVVGAGAMVVKDVPDYAIVAGVPARIIGDVRQEGKL